MWGPEISTKTNENIIISTHYTLFGAKLFEQKNWDNLAEAAASGMIVNQYEPLSEEGMLIHHQRM